MWAYRGYKAYKSAKKVYKTYKTVKKIKKVKPKKKIKPRPKPKYRPKVKKVKGKVKAVKKAIRKASSGWRSGREKSFGKNFRVGLGNRKAGNRVARWPHYHRRGVDKKGKTKPGQGIGRHRPWEKKSTDKRFPVLMVADVIPPVVTDDHGDISVYPTVAAACDYMEAIDVRGGVYEAFDSRGQRLSMGVEGGEVRMWVDASKEPAPGELERRLRHFVSEVGADRVGIADLDSAPMDQLIGSLLTFLHRG